MAFVMEWTRMRTKRERKRGSVNVCVVKVTKVRGRLGAGREFGGLRLRPHLPEWKKRETQTRDN